MSDSDSVAGRYAAALDQANTLRKRIERELTDFAVAAARRELEQGAAALVVWLPEGHSGVHGIVASRLVERYNRPVVCLSPLFGSDTLVTGSARSVPGVHIRDVLQTCADTVPGIFVSFGGHAGAAGLTLRREDIDLFRVLLDHAVSTQPASGLESEPGWIVLTDGELPARLLNLELADELASLGPYGREFEAPRFEGEFEVVDARPAGDGTHLRLVLRSGSMRAPGIWFGARESAQAPLPVDAGMRLRAVYELDENEYRGERTLQLILHGPGCSVAGHLDSTVLF
ncbi:hypothetical protein FR698_11675 [Pelomicrobium methylotrophicum]|uniref:Single-stranded-DNA-specific exonuclease RecJ n=1 Tax=Pelomicrobium methylotrophicum TaxID=2602750 RepID=A0A5C7ERC5_9PROT|nr:hypothetical protein FR698_11675 [Pelomicrobium methylotrophicum]